MCPPPLQGNEGIGALSNELYTCDRKGRMKDKGVESRKTGRTGRKEGRRAGRKKEQ